MLLTLSYRLFWVGLVFMPLAFASVELWSMAFAQGFILGSLCLYQLWCWRNTETAWFLPPGFVPLVIFCGYILLQLVPLPPPFLQIISPKTWQIYTDTVWVASPGTWLPLTLTPKATVLEFCRFSAGVALYLLSVQLLSRAELLQKTVRVVIILGAGVAFLAILQKFTSPESIYWMRLAPSPSSPFGPWVSRNHYAGFMEMLLPIILALFLYYIPRIRYKTGWRRKWAMLLAMPEAHVHLLLGAAALVIAVSIFLSLSRSGIATLAWSLLFFAFLLRKKKYGDLKGLILAVIVLLTILAVTWFGWQPIVERFDHLVTEEGELTDGRFAVWRDTLAIIRDFPLTGAGFGSYLDVYRGYREAPGHAVYDHAHNDYLELFTNGGVIAVLLIGWFIISLLRKTLAIIEKRHDRFAILLYYGIFCGLLAFLLHGITDFNFYNGANTFYFFFYCGLLVAVASVRRHSRRNKYYLAPSTSPAVGYIFLPVSALLAFSLFCHFGQLSGQYLYSQLQHNGIQDQQGETTVNNHLDNLAAISRRDPLEAKYRFTAAQELFAAGDRASAQEHVLAAVQLRPLSCEYLQWLGYLIYPDDPAHGDELYQTSIQLNPKQVPCIQSYLVRLFYEKRSNKAAEVLAAALSREPSDSHYYFELLANNRLTAEEIGRILPAHTEAYLQYAKFLWEKNNREDAIATYEKGLAYLAPQEVKAWYFSLGISWYRQLAQEEKLFQLIRQAAQWLPEHADFHEKLGDLYQKRGILYRALAEYDRVLVIEPANSRVRNKIGKIQGMGLVAD